MPSIPLTLAERQELFDHYRRDAYPEVRLRAHILLNGFGGEVAASLRAAGEGGITFTRPGQSHSVRHRFLRNGGGLIGTVTGGE